MAWRFRERWKRLLRPDPAREIRDELAHHLEERVRDYIERGLDPEAARQAALERLGDLDAVRRDCVGVIAADRRAEERRTVARVSWLDVKLGIRMLRKYPGLSLVSAFGMAVAIAIAAGGFGFIEAVVDPDLPLPEGERIVSLQNDDRRNPGNPHRQILHDFLDWREELRSVQHLAAFRTDRRNVIDEGGAAHLLRVAEMSAAGFQVARVPPLLGRPLLPDDERPGAPAVVVIGYDEWQRRFGGDPDIVGRTIRLGATVHTVVGVMPPDFRFPVNHGLWVPLRLDPSGHERGGGPTIAVFGRLADGATRKEAQAELASLGLRASATYPDTHEHLRPRVLPYTHPFSDIDNPAIELALRAVQVALGMLLALVAVNVAVLVYARTAARSGEIAVRSALGASRRRIVTQLFVEALVLASVAAAVGLAIAGVGFASAQRILETGVGGPIPFWIHLGLTPDLVVYVAGLAVLAAIIVGVLPALKATGRSVQARLQRVSSGGGGMQLGPTWTALIVAQVAVAVAVLPFATYIAGQSLRRASARPGYPAQQFLRTAVSLEREEAPAAAVAEDYERAVRARFVDRTTELVRRLQAEPGIAGVTFGSTPPGGGAYRLLDIEGGGRLETSSGSRVQARGWWVRASEVDPRLFDVLGVPVLAGRGFEDADTHEDAAVVVDRAFADRVLGGGSPVGRRVRFITRTPEGAELGPWFEVVGMVPDFTVQYDFDPSEPHVYHANTLATLASATTVTLSVRVRGDDASVFAGRLRDIAVAVDPGLQLHDLQSDAAHHRQEQTVLLYPALGFLALTLAVVFLSAAGIYAMMSFTVARRRREIGIRTALGAEPGQLLRAVFARAGRQLVIGVLAGLVLAAALNWPLAGGLMLGSAAALLPAVAALMMVVGLLATLGPARRGLAVQPMEVLREE